jgi:hypothetical protein
VVGGGGSVGCVILAGCGLLGSLSVWQPLSIMSAAAARQVMMSVFIMILVGLFDQKFN